MSDKPPIDWEAIEREYRAGQLSIRAIAAQFGLTEGAIRKKAKALNWNRPLADKVREAVREKLVREDGTQGGTHSLKDAEIVDGASARGFQVVLSHRKDLTQLHGIKRILMDRLAAILNGEPIDGPCLGAESPGELLERLARTTARLIPLERQAHNLDEREMNPLERLQSVDRPPRETRAEWEERKRMEMLK